jgi:serine/threonine-protein kinase
MPIQQPPPNGAGSRSKKWILAGVGIAAAIFAVVIALVTTGVFKGGGNPSPTPAASASSSTTTTSASEGTGTAVAAAALSGDDARLLALLPRGYASDSCKPVNPPVENALSTLDCTGNSEPGGPTSSRYSLFANTNALARQFQLTVNEDTALPCPGDSGATPGTWHYNSTPNQTAGSVACGTYQGTPEVVWTNEPQLVLGDAQGPNLDAVHQWWLKYA